MTRYLNIAPWCAPIDLPEPECSGPMSRAWSEITPRLRAMAWQTLHDDAAAQRAAAQHRAEYPHAYRPATPSTVPHRSSVFAAGTGWDHDGMEFGALLRDDVTGTGVTLYDVVMAPSMPRVGRSPRGSHSPGIWTGGPMRSSSRMKCPRGWPGIATCVRTATLTTRVGRITT